MLDIKNLLRRTFSNRKQSEVLITNLAGNIIKTNLKISTDFNIYRKNDLLFIKDNPFIWNMIFLNKKNLITLINEKLNSFWYSIKIRDIIMK